MAIGKSQIQINLVNSVSILEILKLLKGGVSVDYDEILLKEFMKNENRSNYRFKNGSKNFTVYTMDLTKKYIEINADYRS